MRYSWIWVYITLIVVITSADASDSPGCFRVIAANGKATAGSAWLIDGEQGLLLTAAHVAGMAGCKKKDDLLKIEAIRIANELNPDRVLRMPMRAKLLCWGAPDNADVVAWLEQIKLDASLEDWALLQVQDVDNDPAAAVLEYFHPFTIEPFATANDLQIMARGGTPFTAIGFPDGTEGEQAIDGMLSQRPSLRDLWTLSAPVRGGNSGGPLICTESGRPVAWGMIVHESAAGVVLNDQYALAIGLYSIFDKVAEKAPLGVRINRVVDALKRPSENRTDAEWLRVLHSLSSMTCFEHSQLVNELCAADSQELIRILRVYYSEYRASYLLERLLDCNKQAASVLAEHARTVAAARPGEKVDEIDALIILKSGRYVLARSGDDHWLDNQDRTAVANLLARAVLVADKAEGWAGGSDFRKSAALLAVKLSPPKVASERKDAIAVFAAAADSSWDFTTLTPEQRANYAVALADSVKVNTNGEAVEFGVGAPYKVELLDKLLGGTGVRLADKNAYIVTLGTPKLKEFKDAVNLVLKTDGGSTDATYNKAKELVESNPK